MDALLTVRHEGSILVILRQNGEFADWIAAHEETWRVNHATELGEVTKESQASWLCWFPKTLLLEFHFYHFHTYQHEWIRL